MKLIAIAECPQGQGPGQIFDATDDAARILIQVGCAKPYEAIPPAHEPTPVIARRLRRRDLRAED